VAVVDMAEIRRLRRHDDVSVIPIKNSEDRWSVRPFNMWWQFWKTATI